MPFQPPFTHALELFILYDRNFPRSWSLGGWRERSSKQQAPLHPVNAIRSLAWKTSDLYMMAKCHLMLNKPSLILLLYLFALCRWLHHLGTPHDEDETSRNTEKRKEAFPCLRRSRHTTETELANYNKNKTSRAPPISRSLPLRKHRNFSSQQILLYGIFISFRWAREARGILPHNKRWRK